VGASDERRSGRPAAPSAHTPPGRPASPPQPSACAGPAAAHAPPAVPRRSRVEPALTGVTRGCLGTTGARLGGSATRWHGIIPLPPDESRGTTSSTLGERRDGTADQGHPGAAAVRRRAARGRGCADRDHAGQLAGQVAPLGSDWAGGAQQRFETLWAEWQSSARNLHQALEGTSTLMRGAGTSFATHDSEVAATFNRGV